MRGPDRKLVAVKNIDRRSFLFIAAGSVIGPRLSHAQPAVTRPVVSEKACPLETIAPVAADGHRGLAVLRKPPGAGPFPVIVWFHGGITTVPLARLEATARDLATGSRFLAAGYVFVAPTYRSRDVDLQTTDSVEDGLAVVDTSASFRLSADRASSWADAVEVGIWRFRSPRAPASARLSPKSRQSC